MATRDDDLNDESWDIRQTFAYFGLAFYEASVLERGLVNTLLCGEFLMQVKQRYVATRGRGFDRRQFEAEFDAFLSEQFKLTMGNIIRRVNALPIFSDEMKERIDVAKGRRDYLAHHY
jgi:hypothetical protein